MANMEASMATSLPQNSKLENTSNYFLSKYRIESVLEVKNLWKYVMWDGGDGIDTQFWVDIVAIAIVTSLATTNTFLNATKRQKVHVFSVL